MKKKAKKKDNRSCRITQKQKQEVGEDSADLHNFSEQFLGLKLYPWQRAAMGDISRKNSRVAVRAANGSGKTRQISAPAAFWNAIVNPGSTTVVTSGVMRQIKEQFWPALRDISRPFQASLNISVNASDMHIGATDSRIVGFTARDGGMFEGFHVTGIHKSLLIILDEAKSIDVDIFRAVERCQPDRLLMVSSPGNREGGFYRAWAQEEDIWKLHVVTAFDCPHIKREWIDLQMRKWGEDDPLIKSMIYAEWMDDEGALIVIPHGIYEGSLNDPPAQEGMEKVAGVDFAAGGDENVIVIRNGNQVMEPIAWKENDTMKAVQRFIQEFKAHGITGDNVFADSGGLGGPMCDRLSEMGFPVNRVNFGSRANENDVYVNRVAELWFEAKRKMERHDIRIPVDETLGKQLFTRRFRRQENTAKIALESKDDVRKRGGTSPDRADAFVLCVAGERWATEKGDVIARPLLSDILDDGEEPEIVGTYH
tara:strand:- start:1204 stop:2646 length:1443 start_codon:yes stop_codon:yes gene_type:complete